MCSAGVGNSKALGQVPSSGGLGRMVAQQGYCSGARTSALSTEDKYRCFCEMWFLNAGNSFQLHTHKHTHTSPKLGKEHTSVGPIGSKDLACTTVATEAGVWGLRKRKGKTHGTESKLDQILALPLTLGDRGGVYRPL